jgi:hypothetical protein
MKPESCLPPAEHSPEIVGHLRTGPSGQIWDLKAKLKRNTYYGLVEIGPVEKKEDEGGKEDEGTGS